jgi:repressor LexA
MFDASTPERALTAKQQAVLDVVRDQCAEHGYPPTVREIAVILGVASTSTVHSHLAALERAGALVRDPTKPRALTLRDEPARPAPVALHAVPPPHDDESSVALPLIGRVAAGAPILAEEHHEDHVRVPTMLTRRGESFLLKVRGDSMIGAGILDGDYVVVRHQAAADQGQIVIAMVDGEATCKRLDTSRGRIRLLPENPDMQPIEPDECEIAGVVTGVLRAL